MDRSEGPIPDPSLDDLAQVRVDVQEVALRFLVEVLPPGQDLAQDHRGEKGVLLVDLAEDRDELPEQLAGRSFGPAQAQELLDGRDEGRRQDGLVESFLAAEVVMDHRLVDPGLPGDEFHRRPVESARGEQLAARPQERLSGQAGVSCSFGLQHRGRHY